MLKRWRRSTSSVVGSGAAVKVAGARAHGTVVGCCVVRNKYGAGRHLQFPLLPTVSFDCCCALYYCRRSCASFAPLCTLLGMVSQTILVGLLTHTRSAGAVYGSIRYAITFVVAYLHDTKSWFVMLNQEPTKTCGSHAAAAHRKQLRPQQHSAHENNHTANHTCIYNMSATEQDRVNRLLALTDDGVNHHDDKRNNLYSLVDTILKKDMLKSLSFSLGDNPLLWSDFIVEYANVLTEGRIPPPIAAVHIAKMIKEPLINLPSIEKASNEQIAATDAPTKYKHLGVPGSL